MKMAMNRKTFYEEILVIGIVFLATNDRCTVTATSIASITSSGDGDGLLISTAAAGEISLSNPMKNVSYAPSTAAEMYSSGETDETTFSLEIFTDETTSQENFQVSSSSVADTTTVGAEETSSMGTTIAVTKVLETSSEMESNATDDNVTTAVIPNTTTFPITLKTSSEMESNATDDNVTTAVIPHTTTFPITTIEIEIPVTTSFETTAELTTIPTTTVEFETTAAFETTADSTTIPITIPITTPFETTAAFETTAYPTPIPTPNPTKTAPFETPTPTDSTITTRTSTTTAPSSMPSTIKPTPEPNPCDPNPCRNQGNCTKVSSTSYTCSCVPGYTNHSCEVEINECQSYPCYGFGKCVDLVNDYECTCNPGYTRNSSNSHHCIAIDYCSQSNYTCFNNGTCMNQPQYSRYYCQCPPSPDNITFYTGLDCGDVTTTFPVPTDISPRSGILAGGARLTVTGRGLETLVPFGAYFRSREGKNLSELSGNVDPYNVTDTSIVIISPLATGAYVDRSLEVILNYNGPHNVTIPGASFMYQGDPVINDIQPRDILAAGGVNITVIGSNMDVVTNPLMDITTIILNGTTKNSTKANYKESCSAHNKTEMTCRIPQGIVPEVFQVNRSSAASAKSGAALLRLSPIVNWHRRRRQKREPIASLNDSLTNSTFEMYLGFVLDDLPTYENTSKSLPHITLTLVTTLPTIVAQDNPEEFNPQTQTVAYIKGSNLTLGCSIADYTVKVGNETCLVTDLTDNEITYMPPKEEPTTPDCETTGETFTVTVKVSTVTQKAYCLRYVSGPSDSDLALIIGVSVAVGVIVLFLLIVGLYLIVRRQRSKNRKTMRSDSYDRATFSSREQNDYEDNNSQRSIEPDYLEALQDDAAHVSVTGPRPEDAGVDVYHVATIHRQGPSYYNANSAGNDDDGRVLAREGPTQRRWDYDPNDEALEFDLKQVKFERDSDRLPTISFYVNDDDDDDFRQSTTSFT